MASARMGKLLLRLRLLSAATMAKSTNSRSSARGGYWTGARSSMTDATELCRSLVALIMMVCSRGAARVPLLLCPMHLGLFEVAC